MKIKHIILKAGEESEDIETASSVIETYWDNNTAHIIVKVFDNRK